jgi:hypothetical protein
MGRMGEDAPAPSRADSARCRGGSCPAAGFGTLDGNGAVGKCSIAPDPLATAIRRRPATRVRADATGGADAGLTRPSPRQRRQSEAIRLRRATLTTSPRREYPHPAHSTASLADFARRCQSIRAKSQDLACDLTSSRCLGNKSQAPSRADAAPFGIRSRPACGFGTLGANDTLRKRAKTPIPVGTAGEAGAAAGETGTTFQRPVRSAPVAWKVGGLAEHPLGRPGSRAPLPPCAAVPTTSISDPVTPSEVPTRMQAGQRGRVRTQAKSVSYSTSRSPTGPAGGETEVSEDATMAH